MKVGPHLTEHVVTVLGVCAGLLGIASLTRLVLERLRPGKDYSELRSRIRSWWVMAGLLLGSIAWGKGAATLFLGFVSFLALKEYLSLVPTRRSDRRVLFWLYVTIPIQFWTVHTAWYGFFIVLIPVYVFMWVPMRMVTLGQTKDFLKAIGILQWGVMACVYSLSHLAFLLQLDETKNPVGKGAGLLLFVILVTELNDVAQFIWGKTLGRRPVVPTVSPKKTWEGLVGGVLTTGFVGAVLGPWMTPLNAVQGFGLCIVLGVVGFFGDVTISAIKRDLGVKDSGTWIPGHGGILDRVDSLTFTAPLFFHLMRFGFKL